MDNQYTYYTPGSDNQDYYTKEPKQKKRVPKFVKLLAAALVFGLVAGAAFEIAGIAVGRLLGDPEREAQDLAPTETAPKTEIQSSFPVPLFPFLHLPPRTVISLVFFFRNIQCEFFIS